MDDSFVAQRAGSVKWPEDGSFAGRARRLVDERLKRHAAARAAGDEADGAEWRTASDAFERDFLARLAAAEERDEAGLTHQHLRTAHALDELSLETAERDDDPSLMAGGIGRAHAPSSKEVERVAALFWQQPAAKRTHLSSSSTAVEGSFDMPSELELDWPTFTKLVALVQRPADGAQHSEAQRAGWSRIFNSIDADHSGTLSAAKIGRFLQRQRRAEAEAEEEHALHEREHVLRGSALAEHLQHQVDDHLAQKRAQEAALHAIEQATASHTSHPMGAMLALFPLVAALAPPLFRCERATLWLARDAARDGGANPTIGVRRRRELYTIGAEEEESGEQRADHWAAAAARLSTAAHEHERVAESASADDEIVVPVCVFCRAPLLCNGDAIAHALRARIL